MKNSHTREVKVLAYKRLKNSTMGNPKYEIAYQWYGYGELASFIGTTATNASCGYLFGIHSVGKIYNITYHFTKLGQIIIDYAEEVINND